MIATMAKDLLAFRADADLLARVDRLVTQLVDAAPEGLEVTRSSAARVALIRGLAAFEAEAEATPAKRGKRGRPEQP